MKTFIRYYGSMWSKARYLPKPRRDSVVVEPFAGGLGYSAYWEPEVVIGFDVDEKVVEFWTTYLSMSPDEILDIPLTTQYRGRKLVDVPLSDRQRVIVSWWEDLSRPGPSKSVRKFKSLSERVRRELRGDIWGPSSRSRLAAQRSRVGSWSIDLLSYDEIDVEDLTRKWGNLTWVVDPPYQEKGFVYKHGSAEIDYDHLDRWVRTLPGLVICVESGNPKWGGPWTPIDPRGSRNTRGIRGSGHGSQSLVWVLENVR